LYFNTRKLTGEWNGAQLSNIFIFWCAWRGVVVAVGGVGVVVAVGVVVPVV
jgi:hypothetical protein